LDFQFLTTEFGFAKEFYDHCKKGVALYFHVCLPGNELLGHKKEQKFT
jgi:hypothetical protein